MTILRRLFHALRIVVLLGIGGVLFHPAVGEAVEIDHLDVDHDKGRYMIQAEVIVSLPLHQVHEGIIDVEHLEHLSSDILDSRLIEKKSNNRLLARMNLRSCILVFCLERTLTQTVLVKGREIAFVITPAKSGFRSGWVRWKLLDNGQGTRVRYTSELVPDFWVPPMIGPFLLAGKFRDNTVEVMERLERRFAPEQTPRE
ncbi:MAG: hypothetical protein HQL76_15855 [Magnetococcales bacterium]|nr:hypothetical protein [Magnetococcales bacterium]